MLKMEDLDLLDIWYKQDFTTCLTSRETMTQLREEFSEQFISQLGQSAVLD